MAFGFIKKIFSFGKKQVEEVPAEGDAPEITQPRPMEAPSPLRGGPDGGTSAETQGAEAEAGRGGVAPSEGATVTTPPPPEAETPAPSSGPSAHILPAEEKSEAATPVPSSPPRGEGGEAKAEPGEGASKPAKKTAPKLPRPTPAKPQAKEKPQPEVPAEPASPPKPVAPETAPEPELKEESSARPPSPLRGSEGRARPVARPEIGDPSVEAQRAKAEADRGGVAETPSATSSEATTSTAETTPSGPAGHLPPKGGEHVAARVTVAKSVERAAEAAPAPEPEQPKASWLQRLRSGLSRSSKELSTSISGVFTKRKLDEATLEELEDVLIRADLGAETAMRIADTLSASRYGRDVSDQEVRSVMAAEIEKVLSPVAQALELDLSHKPHVILVVGVNGTGKTTTIGKLAAKLTGGGLSVTLAAGDTFRAAAIEQLKIWGERTNSSVIASKLGADAAGLAWDAYDQASKAGSDVLIIDTAGRLQNKAELMAELEKIVRVLGKHDAEAPHTVLLTVDATTGQNALNQVEIFRNVAGVNGIVMTKLDGTARGGILVAIAAKHKLPVYFIGVGEQVDDLEPFSAHDFAAAIAGTETA